MIGLATGVGCDLCRYFSARCVSARSRTDTCQGSQLQSKDFPAFTEAKNDRIGAGERRGFFSFCRTPVRDPFLACGALMPRKQPGLCRESFSFASLDKTGQERCLNQLDLPNADRRDACLTWFGLAWVDWASLLSPTSTRKSLPLRFVFYSEGRGRMMDQARDPLRQIVLRQVKQRRLRQVAPTQDRR
jgi:hypothetical protein